ncbi:MAG: sensor histidine kinase [Gammaproteobacteria bacterium]|jgi:two-component system sensor histidine kinase AlgZ
MKEQASIAAVSFLPDFCSRQAALGVVLIAELVAFVLALSRAPLSWHFWVDLAVISLFLQWIALSSAAVLCYGGRSLARLPLHQATAAVYVLLLLTSGIISELTFQLASHTGVGRGLVPSHHLDFLLRNLAISAILYALVLRYFYVQHQWRQNVTREAAARTEALQARIRPHFLFNSLNTIAALVRSRPDTAEQTIEDLAELFRASLSEAGERVALADEIEFTRLYERMESLRLGDRLKVEWHVEDAPADLRVPRLVLQPLLENAIYHGIEPLPEGGTVRIRVARNGNSVSLSVENPVGNARRQGMRPGNRMALDNIRQRLELAWPGRATMQVDNGDETYRVTIQLPIENQGT